MKRITSLFLLLFSLSATANEAVTFSADEISHIGIELGQPILVSHSLSNKLPAQVTIPNKSQRVISAPQDGVVEIMMVAEGDNVVAGQALAQMNSPQLLASQNDYLQALSRMSQSLREMRRDKSLFEEGIIAERRYRQSQSSYQQDKTEVALYKKSLELAGMDVKAIKQLYNTRELNSHLTVTAVSDGVVMKQFATAGQRLTAADPIYKIAQLSPLWLEIHVPLDIVQQVKVNDPLIVCEKEINGHVIAVGREVHAADQGVLVRAKVSKNTEQLTPGEFIQVCFVQQSDEPQFELPRTAIFRYESNTAVFVKTEEGFVNQIVKVTSERGDKVIVSGALSIDQKIVIKGTATVKSAWLGGE
ncbi:MAG: efflux transporter periplasmic adaptor subunit [Methylophaga sp.]|nr:MAG: efflux transporter periplasmic adaptor subunit [Methylophaga sp.]